MWQPLEKLKHWWAQRRKSTDPVESLLMEPVQDPQQAMVGLAKAFVLDVQRREAELRRAAQFRRWIVAVLVLVSVLAYAVTGARLMGIGGGARAKEPSVALVKVEGQISATSKLASADKVTAALEKAFEDPKVERVLLYIDSPGGAPVEAERISDAIAHLRQKHNKPIQAVIGNLGASAGYMVALSADEIVAGKYSLVGSIGAVLMAWNVHKVLERFDVEAKSYASGKLKSMLNPFEASTPEGDAKAQALVDELGRQFAALLKERRAGKLTQAPESYTSGEVWGGQEALKLGLIDANGTIETLMAQHPDLKLVNFGPFDRSNNLLSGLMQSAQDIAVSLRQLLALTQGQGTLQR